MDFKLENMVFTDAYDIALIDFCFAQLNDDHISKPLGTKFYMAPEVVDRMFDSKVTFSGNKADIYSLGLCFFMIIFCAHPFREQNSQCLFYKYLSQEKFEDFFSAHKGHRRSLKELNLIQSCLRKNPEDRPTTEELLQMPYFTEKKIKLTKSISREINMYLTM